jgi:hypothetical protein
MTHYISVQKLPSERHYRSRIHARTVSLRFLALRLEVSVHNVYITKLQTTFVWGGGGGVESFSRGDCKKQGGKLYRLLSQLRPRIPPQYSGIWNLKPKRHIFNRRKDFNHQSVCFLYVHN